MIDNAIIIAAGASSRFAPLSYERHKALTEIKGEILIERLLGQLNAAGIKDIYIVTGYKAQQFDYLTDKCGVRLISNPAYQVRNNNSSIWAARDILSNSLVIASDLYFVSNPFTDDADEAWYAAEYAQGATSEWCLHEDENGYIDSVKIGGENAWYMLDHAFWSSDFSRRFLHILERSYNEPQTAGKLWETIFMEHLDELKMTVRKYAPGTVYEFDSLDSLRAFDPTYVSDSRSAILKKAAARLSAEEKDITSIRPLMGSGAEAEGFSFRCRGLIYEYQYKNEELKEGK